MLSLRFRIPSWSIGGALAAAISLAGTTGSAQQTNLDPYKPDLRNYQSFATPSASLRPGFPNPIGGGRPTYGNFNPNDLGYGGFEPFAAPYFNRNINLNTNRAVSAFDRSMADFSNRPQNLVDPQERADRLFFEKQAERDDPYQKLEKKRDDLYFKALAEPDLKKRAKLLKEYQQATMQSAQAFSSSRRTPGETPAASRRTVGPNARRVIGSPTDTADPEKKPTTPGATETPGSNLPMRRGR